MLETKNLCYHLKNRTLLKEISLSFTTGKLWGIVGLNGSGKSTLLKNLSGIWKPTSGELLWQGAPLLDNDRRNISRTVTLVPQNPQIHFNYTVDQFVAMGRYPHDKALHAQKELPKVLELVDATHLRGQVMTQLSCGERQRVYIARAVLTASPIMLFDEPTASLDIGHQQLIWQMLRDLADSGKLVIVSLHDLMAASKFCDEIVLLHEGNCIATGPFNSTITPNRLQEIFGINEKNCTISPTMCYK